MRTGTLAIRWPFPEFPRSAYAIPRPEQRWFPADEALRTTAYEKLLPPLVAKIREQVSAWRDASYPGVSATSRSLLKWWFQSQHVVEQADSSMAEFRYYFAHREAVEKVIWLYDDQGGFERQPPTSFPALMAGFVEYQA